MDLIEEMPLGDSETTEEASGFSLGYETAQLSYGEGIEEQAFSKITKSMPDYVENAKYYDAWANANDWTAGNTNTARYDMAAVDGTFKLNEDNEVVLGEKGVIGSELLFDMDAMKGILLAQKQGYTQETFDTEYSSIAKQRAEQIAKQREGTSTLGYIGGVIAGHITQPETFQEIATSPAKVMGSTILKGMGKAFVAESAVGLVGEVSREQRIREHMEKANLEYTLWDSVSQILIGAGLAGTFRAIGSGVVDAKTAREINKRVPDGADKELVNRFFQREEYKLTADTNKHIAMQQKARTDMDDGKDVDIGDSADIDISTKTSPEVEEVSLRGELEQRDIDSGYPDEIENMEVEITAAEKQPIPKETEPTTDKYDGMTTPEEGDAKIYDNLEGEDLEQFKANEEEIARIKSPKEEAPIVESIATSTIVANAQAAKGSKYVWGGTSIKNGSDCSGFVQSLNKEQGINLPRTAWGQAKSNIGENVKLNDMQIGDTIYFKPSRTGKKYAPVTHVGIITGMKNGKYIMTHAKGKNYGVVEEELSQAYINRFYTAKRYGDGKATTDAPTPTQAVEVADVKPTQEETITLKQEAEDTEYFNQLQAKEDALLEVVEAPKTDWDAMESKTEPKPFTPKQSKQKIAAKTKAEEKRQQLEKQFGGDEDKIKEGMKIPSKKKVLPDSEKLYKGMSKADIKEIDDAHIAKVKANAEFVKNATDEEKAFDGLSDEEQIAILSYLDKETLEKVIPFGLIAIIMSIIEEHNNGTR